MLLIRFAMLMLSIDFRRCLILSPMPLATPLRFDFHTPLILFDAFTVYFS